MNKLLFAPLIILSFILSTAVMPRLPLAFGMIDLNLAIILCYAMLNGEVRGAAFGFCAGLAFDLLLANIIGFNALLGFLAGYASGAFLKHSKEAQMIYSALIALVIVFLYQLANYAGLSIFFAQTDFLRAIHRIIIPKSILTTIFFIVACFLINLCAKNKDSRGSF